MSLIEQQQNRKINIMIEPSEMIKHKSVALNQTTEKIKRK